MQRKCQETSALCTCTTRRTGPETKGPLMFVSKPHRSLTVDLHPSLPWPYYLGKSCDPPDTSTLPNEGLPT